MSIVDFKENVKEYIAMTLLNFEDIQLSQIQTRELLRTKNLNMIADDLDILIITNLLKTFDYVESLDLKNTEINIDLYKKLNEMLAFEQALFSGVVRTQDTYIGCIDGSIPPCTEDQISVELYKLNNLTIDNHKDQIADCFMNLIRMQPFYDGNKRSSLFLCNLALAKNNYGSFTIPNSKYTSFEDKLTLFYRDNKREPLKEMIKNELISSELSIEQKQEQPQNLVRG